MSELSTQSYSEYALRSPFNWREALTNIDKFDFEQWQHLDKLARSWVTCACGNQCAIIPRDFRGEPQDDELRLLGLRFMEAIELRAPQEALFTLNGIEERSQELIDQLSREP